MPLPPPNKPIGEPAPTSTTDAYTVESLADELGIEVGDVNRALMDADSSAKPKTVNAVLTPEMVEVVKAAQTSTGSMATSRRTIWSSDPALPAPEPASLSGPFDWLADDPDNDLIAPPPTSETAEPARRGVRRRMRAAGERMGFGPEPSHDSASEANPADEADEALEGAVAPSTEATAPTVAVPVVVVEEPAPVDLVIVPPVPVRPRLQRDDVPFDRTAYEANKTRFIESTLHDADELTKLFPEPTTAP